MQKLLALDLGLRHTGVAFYDPSIQIPLPLDTLHHANQKEFASMVHALVKEREVQHLIIGLPLSLDGTEGSQVHIVRDWVDSLQLPDDFVTYIDERYSNQPHPGQEDHSSAACAILTTFIDRKLGK